MVVQDLIRVTRIILNVAITRSFLANISCGFSRCLLGSSFGDSRTWSRTEINWSHTAQGNLLRTRFPPRWRRTREHNTISTFELYIFMFDQKRLEYEERYHVCVPATTLYYVYFNNGINFRWTLQYILDIVSHSFVVTDHTQRGDTWFVHDLHPDESNH